MRSSGLPAAVVMIGLAGRQSAAHARGYGGAIDAVIVILVLALLLPRLDRFGGLPQTWETGVLTFWEALYTHSTLMQFLREHVACFPSGVFSEGHTALLYGIPALALMQVFGFSLWTLRLPSVGAVVLAAILIRRTSARLYGWLAGATAGLAFACNAAVLFYGRYASSLAATMLGCTLAWWACARFVMARGWRTLPWAVVTAAALAVATLEYAPGRLVALGLLVVLPLGIWRHRTVWHIAGLVLLLALLAVGWRLERPCTRDFLAARGEAVNTCLLQPECIRAAVGHEPDGSWRDTLTVGWVWATRNLPAYAAFLWPGTNALDYTLNDSGGGSLPYLAWPPWVVLALLGAVSSLVRVLRWEYGVLFIWWLAISVPGALLTSHADPHRLALLTVPCAVFGGIAFERLVAVLRSRLRMRAFSVLFGCGVVLTACTVRHDLRVLPYLDTPVPAPARALAAAMRDERAVDVATDLDTNELTWVLAEAAQGRAEAAEPPRLLNAEMRQQLVAGDPAAIASTVGAGRLLLLYPAADFQAAVPALSTAGDVSVRDGVMAVRWRGGTPTTVTEPRLPPE